MNEWFQIPQQSFPTDVTYPAPTQQGGPNWESNKGQPVTPTIDPTPQRPEPPPNNQPKPDQPPQPGK